MIDNSDERAREIWKRNLHIFLVLSMIGSGFALISNIVWGVGLPTMKEMLESGEMVLPSEMTVMMEELIQTPKSFYLCSALLYAASLIGVVLMWNVRKSGFHLYTLAQLLVLLTGVLFLGKDHLVLGDVMLTILFVTYYFMSLKRLGAFNQETEADNKHNETAADEEA